MNSYILTDPDTHVVLDFFRAEDDIAATKKVEKDETNIKAEELILYRMEKVCDWSE